MQEQYRMPTAEEIEILKREGVPSIGPGSLVPNGNGVGAIDNTFTLAPNVPNNSAVAPAPSTVGKAVKIGAILAGVAVTGFVGYKYVWPMVSGGPTPPRENGNDDDDDDDDDGED
jgi:hypothetical protein